MIVSFFNFIQYEVLGMNWLAVLTGTFLEKCGIDIDSRIGGTLHFFLFDVIKIMLLLFVLIMILSYIGTYFPPERARGVLERMNNFGANILAALFGTVTSFCSCSSIPIFIGFTSAGLPMGVTFSFLISSPMVDFASFALLVSIWGWKVAFTYVITGLIIAIVGGYIIGKLKMEDQVADFINRNHETDVQLVKIRIRERISLACEEAISTIKKMVIFIVFGVAIGAFIHNWIPEEIIVKLLGKGNPFGVIIASLVGAPIYADIFQTISIADALVEKGADLGVVIALMMSITTLSLPSMIMLRKVMKRKLLFTFVLTCVVGIVIIGYGFNLIQSLML